MLGAAGRGGGGREAGVHRRDGAFTGGMVLLASLRRRAALLAVLGGFGVFAAALGGMTSVDADLRAVAPLDTTEVVRIELTDRPANACDHSREDEERLSLGREL